VAQVVQQDYRHRLFVVMLLTEGLSRRSGGVQQGEQRLMVGALDDRYRI